MLAFDGVCKSFDGRAAVEQLTFEVRPGTVVGFVGPNGAGKTTSLRILLGLVTPDSGRATVRGMTYAALPDPPATVGAALESQGFYPGRSGRRQLRIAARACGRAPAVGDETLELVGLGGAADGRVGDYSLGMRMRLSLGCALVAEPSALVLDEPTTGLDRDGVRWLWGLLRTQAERGCAILVSSHALHELEQVADEVAILVGGRLVAIGPIAELGAGRRATRVRSNSSDRLMVALREAGIEARTQDADRLLVVADAASVGRIALEQGIVISELHDVGGDLGQLFDELRRS